MRTGRTRSSRWPTGAPRRSATRCSTRSPSDRDQRARDAVLLDRVQEDPAAVLHRRVQGLGARARLSVPRQARAAGTAARDRIAQRHPLGRALPARPGGDPRRGQLARARDARDRPRPDLHRPRRGRRADRRRRQPLHRLRLLVGPVDPRARPSGRSLAAIAEAAARGTSFGAPTPGEVELAGEVARRMDGVEMLRMTSSGTEAAMTAIRLARAATGREPILKFAGAYHGHVDGLLAAGRLGSGDAGAAREPRRARSAPPRRHDRRAVERSRGAARAPPSATSSPRSSPSRCRRTWAWSPPDAGFLELLRERADATGALLVLDEVISGFRVARGGAQELLGVSGRPRRSSARSSAAACPRRPSAAAPS